MASITYADRVKETTTTTGTGTIDLAGAATGFITFVAGVGDGATVYYTIEGTSEWEVGIGTITDAATDTLSRDQVLASSNSNALVNFGAGTKNVYITQPAQSLNTEARNKDLLAAKFLQSTAQTLTSGVSDLVNFDDAASQVFNVGGIQHDPAGGDPTDTRFFVDESLASRRVIVSLAAFFEGVNTTGVRRLTLRHMDSAGGVKDSTAVRQPGTSDAQGNQLCVTEIFDLAEGDYFEVQVFQNAGVNVDVSFVRLSFAVIGETKIDGADRLGAKFKTTTTPIMSALSAATIHDVTFDDADSEFFNLGGITHDPGGGEPERFYVTADLAGKLLYVSSICNWLANATGTRLAQIVHYNSADVALDSAQAQLGPTPTRTWNTSPNGLFRVQAGDYFKLQVRQDSGGTLDLNSAAISFALVGEGGGAGAGEQIAARVSRSTNFSHTTSGAFENIDFDDADAEDYNVGGGVSHDPAGANPERLTILSALDGRVVDVQAAVQWATVAGATRRQIIIRHFDSADTLLASWASLELNLSGLSHLQAVSGQAQVSTGDYFLILARQDSGGALNIEPGTKSTTFAIALTGEGGGNPVGKQIGGLLRRTTDFTGVVSGTGTNIDWDDSDAALFNIGSGMFHDPGGANPDRITVLNALNGRIVQVIAQIAWVAWAADNKTSRVQILHYDSSDTIIGNWISEGAADDVSNNHARNVAVITKVSTGDYFVARCLQRSGSNQDLVATTTGTSFAWAEVGSRGGTGDGSTEAQAYTPTLSWTGGVGTIEAFFQRVGPDMLRCWGYIPITGAVTPAATGLQIGLPTGFTVDTDKIPQSAGFQMISGTARGEESGVGIYHGYMTYNYTNSAVQPRLVTGATTESGLTDTAPFTWGTGDEVQFDFLVPINEIA